MRLYTAISTATEYPWKMTIKLFYAQNGEKLPEPDAIRQGLEFPTDIKYIFIHPVDNVSEDTPQLVGISVISDLLSKS